MKKNLCNSIIVACLLLFTPNKNFAQYLNLGNIENCTIFSVNGAVSNNGTSNFNGIIGANVGAITGFVNTTPSSFTIHNDDDFTAQAKSDLLAVYILLNNVPVTSVYVSTTNFTGKVDPGVYLIKGAGSINGTVTLDANNNSNAIFIFKFQGGFSPASATTVVLANGAKAANVFWIAEGAIAAGINCNLAGTLIAHPGAVSLGSGSSINGRMLSTTGAISFSNGTATLPTTPNTVPIDCVNTCDNNTLGSAVNFTLFTSAGALTNTGVSGVIGDIGSNSDPVIGFGTSIVIGNQYSKTTITSKAADDLATAAAQLFGTATTSTHNAAYGGGAAGEILTPNVYYSNAANSVTGTLTLDGQNDPNSIFIFNINGPLTISSASRVILTNKARRCNIFWVAKGAIAMESFAFMKGNLIAFPGAISMGEEGFLEGRMFSTAGACTFNTATTYISNSLCASSMVNVSTLPIQLTSFTGISYKQNIVLKWTTVTEVNNKSFIIERSTDGINWISIGNVAGAGNSDVIINYTFVDNLASKSNILFYRLKQTYPDNSSKYNKIISVRKAGINEEESLSLSPNPSTGQFNINFSGDKNEISSTEIFNVQGVKVYSSNVYQSKIDLTKQAPGIYLVRVQHNATIITRKIIVAK